MKIERRTFMEELVLLLKDELVAKVEEKNDAIVVRFLSGESFELIVKQD